MPQDNPPLLDKTMNTTEQTSRNLADVLAEELKNIANNVKPDGRDISIDVPGMDADNVNDGFSELKGTLTSLAYPSNSEQLDTRSVSSSEVTINLTATHDGVMQIYYTNSGGSSIGFTVRIREANTKRGMLFNANIPPYMMDEPLICIPCRAGVSYGILYRRTASSGSVDFTIKNLY